MKKFVFIFSLIVISILSSSVDVEFVQASKKIEVKYLGNQIVDSKIEKILFPSIKEIKDPKIRDKVIRPKAIVAKEWIDFYDFISNKKQRISIINKYKTEAFIANDCNTIFVISIGEGEIYDFQVLNRNGKVLWNKKSYNVPFFSKNGQSIVMASPYYPPVEAFEVYNRNGKKLWERGSKGNFIYDIKVLDDGSIISVEEDKSKNLKLVCLNNNGTTKWEYKGIEPKTANYRILASDETITVVALTSIRNIFTFNKKSGKLLWKLQNTIVSDLQEVSKNGKLLIYQSYNGTVLMDNLLGKKLCEKNNLQGPVEVSPSGKFTSLITGDKDGLIILLLNDKGDEVWRLKKAGFQEINFRFITDYLFCYVDNNVINYYSIFD